MSSIDFDEVLLHVGEKGRYQNIMYYLLCIPATLPAAFLAFSQVRIISECRVNIREYCDDWVIRVLVKFNKMRNDKSLDT